MENSNKVSLFSKTWFIIICLLTCLFPLGIFLMWKYKKFNKVLRIVISFIWSFFILISIFSPKNDSVSPRDTNSPVSMVDVPKETSVSTTVDDTPVETAETTAETTTEITPETIVETTAETLVQETQDARELLSAQVKESVEKSCEFTSVSITHISVNENLGTDVSGDYVVLLYLSFDVKNRAKNAKEMIDLLNNQIAADLVEQESISELTLFWAVPYLSDASNNIAKANLLRQSGGFAFQDIWFNPSIFN